MLSLVVLVVLAGGVVQIIAYFKPPAAPLPPVTPVFVSKEAYDFYQVAFSDRLSKLEDYVHNSVHDLRDSQNSVTLKLEQLRLELTKDMRAEMVPLMTKLEALTQAVAVIKVTITRFTTVALDDEQKHDLQPTP